MSQNGCGHTHTQPRPRDELSAFASSERRGLAARVAPPQPCEALPGADGGAMLAGLFEFYAREFDWEGEVASVRLGRRSPRPGSACVLSRLRACGSP